MSRILLINKKLLINAPSRLHFGFLDPSANLGRRFASLGLSITNFDTQLLTRPSKSPRVFGKACTPEIKKTTISLIKRLQTYFGSNDALNVEFISIPPRHSGFGTGTQLALSIAKSFCQHYNFFFSVNELSEVIGRGNRSGIGIAAFECGGFLIDGGKGKNVLLPPILFQKNFPKNWKILLVLDNSMTGLSGEAERAAIKGLPKFSQESSARMCHQTLLKILPAVIEKDFGEFILGLNEIQEIMGNYFSSVQGGSNFSSLKVKELMKWLVERYDVAIGQSSWGPTGFVFFESLEHLESALKEIKKRGLADNPLQIEISEASNFGAITKKIEDTRK